MKKSKLITFALVLLILFVMIQMQINPVYAKPEEGYIVNTTSEITAVDEGFQTMSFYAQGRYWVFYVSSDYLVYSSSTNGMSWTSPTNIISTLYGQDFSACFDGTYLHYARRHHWSDNLYYRRGMPNADGTITWSADEQLIDDGSGTLAFMFPKICVDSEGYAWIGVNRFNASDPSPFRTPWVFKNSMKDGTWSTASGFPYKLNPTTAAFWRVTPVPMTKSKVYIFYASSEIESIYPQGRIWDGVMGAPETISYYYIDYGHQHGIVSVGNDIHLIYRIYVGQGAKFGYFKRTYGVGWGGAELTDIPGVSVSPTLTVDAFSDKLYVFYRDGTTFKTFNKTIDSAWGSVRTFLDESTDDLPPDSGGKKYGAWYQQQNGTIGFVYLTKNTSPYNVKFAFISQLPYQPEIPEPEEVLLDLPAFPLLLAARFNISVEAAQILLVVIFLAMFLFPTLLLTRNIFAHLIMGIMVLSFCLFLGWVPSWIFILITIFCGVLLAGKVKGWITGGGTSE